MDINLVRGLLLLLMVLAFTALYVWTWIGGRDRFREAAMLPFADDEALPETDPKTVAVEEVLR